MTPVEIGLLILLLPTAFIAELSDFPMIPRIVVILSPILVLLSRPTKPVPAIVILLYSICFCAPQNSFACFPPEQKSLERDALMLKDGKCINSGVALVASCLSFGVMVGKRLWR
jgi:hypothetical protein